MPDKPTDSPAERQVAIAQPVAAERTAVARRHQRALTLLQMACHQCDWGSHEALAKFIGCSRAYVTAVLAGEKSCSLKFVASLPGEVRERYACLVAEQYSFVVARQLDTAEALKRLAALVLAVEPLVMAKADLRESAEKVAV
jgi:hypothetical protein